MSEAATPTAEPEVTDPTPKEEMPTPPDPTPDPKAETPASTPPEKYDLKVPENTLSQAILDKTATEARELGLSNEEAQGMVDMQATAVAGYAAEQQAAFEAQQQEWIEKAKSDPEIGGDAFAESAEMAKRGLEKWASPALKAMITDSGFGNHPEILRLFAKLGRHGENDQPPGASPPGGPRTEEEKAQKFYESMKVN
jgi:hypothetical protein